MDTSLPLQTGQHWDEVTYGLLRADFSPPASFVQIDLIFDDDYTGALWAYDSSGNLLESIQAQGDIRGSGSPFCPPFCDEFATVSITRSNADIDIKPRIEKTMSIYWNLVDHSHQYLPNHPLINI